MEKIPNIEIDYEKVLNVEWVDLPSPERLRGDKTLTFSITPEFNIFLSKYFHTDVHLAYGVDPDLTLAEGYVKINKLGDKEVIFKPSFQPIPGFKGSEKELALLQRAAKNKILEFLKNNTIKYENK